MFFARAAWWLVRRLGVRGVLSSRIAWFVVTWLLTRFVRRPRPLGR